MKIVVAREEGAYNLEIIIRVPFGMRISGRIHGLQLFILESIEQFTGLDLNEVNVTVGAIAKPKKRGWGLLRSSSKEENDT